MVDVVWLSAEESGVYKASSCIVDWGVSRWGRRKNEIRKKRSGSGKRLRRMKDDARIPENRARRTLCLHRADGPAVCLCGWW